MAIRSPQVTNVSYSGLILGKVQNVVSGDILGKSAFDMMSAGMAQLSRFPAKA